MIDSVTICQPGAVAESAVIQRESDRPADYLSYPCPVCGEMVDASNAKQILLHHEHVTYPWRFLPARTLAAAVA